MPQQTPLLYNCHYTVQTYDIEKRRRMTVAALVRLMQETAMQHTIQMKVSAWDLEPLHLSWVLFRKNLVIQRLPMFGEKLVVSTSTAGFEKFFTYRDYKVFDEKKEMIASSSSTWLLMDTEERRMVRIPDFILEFAGKIPEDCLPRPKTRLPNFQAAAISKPFRVGWHDLDFNGHLNNVFYLQWMLEALPDEVLQLRVTSRDPDKFNTGDELEQLLRPIVLELKELTSRPREIEAVGRVDEDHRLHPPAGEAVVDQRPLFAREIRPQGLLDRFAPRRTQQVADREIAE